MLGGMRWLLLPVLAFTLSGADAREELLEADRAFARDTAARGLEGWLEWFHEDALVNAPGGVLRGKAVLREYYGKFIGTPGFQLIWAPVEAEASPDGRMGYTVGTGTAVTRKADGTEERRPARYVTVWRRGADGRWKVVTDLGN